MAADQRVRGSREQRSLERVDLPPHMIGCDPGVDAGSAGLAGEASTRRAPRARRIERRDVCDCMIEWVWGVDHRLGLRRLAGLRGRAFSAVVSGDRGWESRRRRFVLALERVASGQRFEEAWRAGGGSPGSGAGIGLRLGRGRIVGRFVVGRHDQQLQWMRRNRSARALSIDEVRVI